MPKPKKSFKSVAVAAARAADDRKAESITVLDVHKSSPVVDVLVIVTALSRPHLEAVEKKIEEELGADGLAVHRRSRPQTDQWRVLDFGGVMIHIMSAEARELYSLERLHAGSREVKWRG
jgi:ribosome-associated protein